MWGGKAAALLVYVVSGSAPWSPSGQDDPPIAKAADSLCPCCAPRAPWVQQRQAYRRLGGALASRGRGGVGVPTLVSRGQRSEMGSPTPALGSSRDHDRQVPEPVWGPSPITPGGHCPHRLLEPVFRRVGLRPPAAQAAPPLQHPSVSRRPWSSFSWDVPAAPWRRPRAKRTSTRWATTVAPSAAQVGAGTPCGGPRSQGWGQGQTSVPHPWLEPLCFQHPASWEA